MDSKRVRRYYDSFSRLNRYLQAGIVIKLALSVALLVGLGRDRFLTLKLMYVLLTVSWWLVWWGIYKQEEIRINQELWQAYIDSFVPVSFTGHIIGYGPVEDLQGHVLNRDVFWFFMPNEPEIMYDAPVENCLGKFIEHRIQEQEQEGEEHAV
jgi:hypothetical protein